MHISCSWPRSVVALVLALSFAASLSPPPAKADPPPWAPAHGWRAKHHHGDDDDDGPRYAAPSGIGQLSCHRDIIGGLLGGAAGGFLGNQFGKGSGKTAATIGGAVAGILVGGAIGRSMDTSDQACVAQALEHGTEHQPMAWTNGNVSYQVAPTRTFQTAGGYCREYETTAMIGGRPQSAFGTACRQPDGSWRIVN